MAGKDTSADMLQYMLSTPKILHYYWIYKLIGDFVPPKWSKVSFADTLKASLSVLLDLPVEKFEDRDFKENYYITRHTNNKFMRRTICTLIKFIMMYNDVK